MEIELITKSSTRKFSNLIVSIIIIFIYSINLGYAQEADCPNPNDCYCPIIHNCTSNSPCNICFTCPICCEWKIDNVEVSSEFNEIPGVSGFSKANAIDNNIATNWSSVAYTTPADIAYMFTGDSLRKVNYIKLRPRYYEPNKTSISFPIDFKVNYHDDSTWVPIQEYTNFPVPKENDWIILPFGKTINAKGIKLESSRFGKDEHGNITYLQFAEVKAGYCPPFEKLIFKENNKDSIYNEIQNVGSGSFDPNKISNWNHDYRRPLLDAHNIYAPNIVNNGAWNIYFGGWLGEQVEDRVYIRTSYDDFETFQGPQQIIYSNRYEHVNNESVIKVSNNDWKMLFTTYENNNTNKPGYATSNDGVTWLPNPVGTLNLISMKGYINWSTADVNGSNVLYNDNGTYNLFFTDFKNLVVHHARGTTVSAYNYAGVALNETKIANDLKSFSYNQEIYYLMGLHYNSDKTWYSLSKNLSVFPSSKVLFLNLNNEDRYITSLGFISHNNRLYGALYGAGNHSSLTKNKIFAAWLQKKVIFVNDKVRFGDLEQADGPNKIRLFMCNSEIETGNFYIYDTDGTTLLYTSPLVTIKRGDVWEYIDE